MHIIGLARLGVDVTVRYLPDGRPVANLALAFNYGKKDDAGKRPTQWIDAAIFGERAEKLAPYLTKGTLVDVHLADPHIETYTDRNGNPGSKIVALVNHLEFAGGGQQQNQNQGQQVPAAGAREQRQNTPRPAPQQRPASDFDDDIPF